ncbi:MAG: di-heme oxidoredictase family protein [Vicinamibacterales bacterium]
MRTRSTRSITVGVAVAVLVWVTVAPLVAQLVDRTLAPNAANEGIGLSLAEQTGAGRGDPSTPDSSRFIIGRDPFRAIRRGRQLFQRKFRSAVGLGPITGDGAGELDRIGEIGAGLSDSCAGCHGRPRGAAGFGGDVATRPDSRDAIHLFGLGLKEMLADEITADLRAARTALVGASARAGRPLSARLTSKGVDYGVLTALPDGTVDTSGVAGVDPDLRVRPFFWHGKTLSIREFVVGALNAEMGLQVADPDLAAAAAGARVVTPAGMTLDGRTDAIEAPPAGGELDPALVDYLEFYLLNYFKPGQHERTAEAAQGLRVFNRLGCASCHRQTLTIEHDRRVADVDTVFDPVRGNLNRLFATATPRLSVHDDGTGYPALKLPARQRFEVTNIFTDFKRHDLGAGFHERNYDGTVRTEFLTAPLWGVGTTAPYGHDGRSVNLREVILRHGGEAQDSRDRFAEAPPRLQRAVTAFLETLVLFPPDDTASNLDPGDRTLPGFPQAGHGSIRLSVLFNDPRRVE